MNVYLRNFLSNLTRRVKSRAVNSLGCCKVEQRNSPCKRHYINLKRRRQNWLVKCESWYPPLPIKQSPHRNGSQSGIQGKQVPRLPPTVAKGVHKTLLIIFQINKQLMLIAFLFVTLFLFPVILANQHGWLGCRPKGSICLICSATFFFIVLWRIVTGHQDPSTLRGGSFIFIVAFWIKSSNHSPFEEKEAGARARV